MFVHCKSCDCVFITGGDIKQPITPVCIMGKCSLEEISKEQAEKLAEEEIERRRNKNKSTR